MTNTVIGRPDDDMVIGLQQQLRDFHTRCRKGLTREEYKQVLQWDRRVRQGRAYFGRERRERAA